MCVKLCMFLELCSQSVQELVLVLDKKMERLIQFEDSIN